MFVHECVILHTCAIRNRLHSCTYVPLFVCAPAGTSHRASLWKMGTDEGGPASGPGQSVGKKQKNLAAGLEELLELKGHTVCLCVHFNNTCLCVHFNNACICMRSFQ